MVVNVPLSSVAVEGVHCMKRQLAHLSIVLALSLWLLFVYL